jgi:peroxiredoxin
MAKPDVGDKAPAFTLEDQSGKTVKLSDFKGKKVVLYFYPKDDTPGCTREACAFRDEHSVLQKAGAVVLGVSPDSGTSHAKFAGKYKLPFREVWSVGREIALRAQVHGNHPLDVPHRRVRQGRPGVAQGEGRRARGPGARGDPGNVRIVRRGESRPRIRRHRDVLEARVLVLTDPRVPLLCAPTCKTGAAPRRS